MSENKASIVTQLVKNIKAEDKVLGRHFDTTEDEYLDMAETLYDNGIRPNGKWTE
jgi:hypothetical protein